ncbi:MAG: ATP-binding protein [bacterium]|nr:ATP-binding protein [bacterium]
MPVKIINSSQIKTKKNLNVIIYGAPGVGKTSFCASAPKPLIIDLEGGTLSIMDRNVDIVEAKTVFNVKEAIDYAVSNNYKTIVFDSLTRFSELLIESITSADKKTKPQVQHWGDLVSKIKKMIWELQGKDINTIFTCLEKESNNDDSLIKRPSLTGQLAQAIPAIVDVTGYLYVTQTGERLLSINPTDKWYAKHRTTLPNRIVEDIEPDFKVLSQRIFRDSNGGELTNHRQA